MPGERRTTPNAPDDDLLDGCPEGDIDPLPDEHVPYFALFAEALDPDSPVTIEQVEAEWADIREAGSK